EGQGGLASPPRRRRERRRGFLLPSAPAGGGAGEPPHEGADRQPWYANRGPEPAPSRRVGSHSLRPERKKSDPSDLSVRRRTTSRSPVGLRRRRFRRGTAQSRGPARRGGRGAPARAARQGSGPLASGGRGARRPATGTSARAAFGHPWHRRRE